MLYIKTVANYVGTVITQVMFARFIVRENNCV